MTDKEQNNRCALCGMPKEEGRKLIVGLHGAVCSDCVSLCNDILLTGGVSPSGSPHAKEMMDRIASLLGGAATSDSGSESGKVRDQLVSMTRELAHPMHGQVILGEGNTSAKDGETLWVKATGNQMPTIDSTGFVQVSISKVLQTMDRSKLSDEELRAALNAARVDKDSKNFPSTETFMHAWLLKLPDVNFVAHTHPINTLGLMCGPRARQFAEQRLFPDQIVLCGPRSVYVPYVAPGFELAHEIRSACNQYTKESGLQPKTILLENHGLIALGKTPKEAVSACLMTEKAAQVFAVTSDPHPLTSDEVQHIHTWTDEHFRQGKIWEE